MDEFAVRRWREEVSMLGLEELGVGRLRGMRWLKAAAFRGRYLADAERSA
jgi:hypothetical protein